MDTRKRVVQRRINVGERVGRTIKKPVLSYNASTGIMDYVIGREFHLIDVNITSK